MILKERVYRLLIVSSSDAFNKAICNYLKDINYIKVFYATCANTAKKEFLESAYDFVLVNSPLSDEFGVHFAIDVTENSSCVTLLFTPIECFADVYDKAYVSGVYVMAKPINRVFLDIAFEWMFTTRERLRKTEKKQCTLEEKMKEIRLVNRAKWILIEQLKMNEVDAHRYIEKQAMDRCITKGEIAEMIIKTYK